MKGRLRREFSDPRRNDRGGRCASCGSDDRLQPHRVGAIEREMLLCRRCLAKARAAEDRERPPG